MTPDDPRIRRNHRTEQDAADRRSSLRKALDWLDSQIGPTWMWLLAGVIVVATAVVVWWYDR